MPQLIPNPWFLIMILSWTIILTIMVSKIISHETTNITTQKSDHKQHNSWTWPW
uniref:ATP synthase complex subunit 8 n=1 Tax=Microcaecilia sp. PZ-2009 TaxID=650642 RepID=C9D8I9_9AMPH|nr:ATP synthase F0 subunit 8 [Microcaecilia sp. PZ-2009]ACS37122.1 ATP synthase F0 subunit 8 [Microcaecilia sp. PZ-2009]